MSPPNSYVFDKILRYTLELYLFMSFEMGTNYTSALIFLMNVYKYVHILRLVLVVYDKSPFVRCSTSLFTF